MVIFLQVLVELLDFSGAKQVLIKAYKLKTPDMKERKEIEKKLKTGENILPCFLIFIFYQND